MVSYDRSFDTWDLLKVVAIGFMFCDHAGIFIFTSDAQSYWLRAFGRAAAPIFLFLAGYARSYRFSWELFALAMVYTVFDWVYFWHISTLNIVFTILLCRMIFQWFAVRGRVIKRPWEWYVCAVVLFVSTAVVDYGSLGFMLALCGYMRRHQEHYSKRLLHGLCALMTATFAFYYTYFPDPPQDIFVSVVVIMMAMLWCMRFTIRPLAGSWGVLKPLSRYSGYVYVAHLVALKAITGIAE